jgi:tetratricopeptide (TPR) repeat protein
MKKKFLDSNSNWFLLGGGVVVAGLVIWALIVWVPRIPVYNQIRTAKAMLATDSKNFDAAMKVGEGYYKLHNLTEAETYLGMARDLNSSSDLPWNLLGNVYRDELKYTDAASAYDMATQLNPTAYQTYLNHAQLFERQAVSGGSDYLYQAVTTLETGAISTNNDPRVVRELVRMYHKTDQADKAETYEAMLKNPPKTTK